VALRGSTVSPMRISGTPPHSGAPGRHGRDLTMIPGSATDGVLFEVGVLDLDGDDPVIIHALPIRTKFYRFPG